MNTHGMFFISGINLFTKNTLNARVPYRNWGELLCYFPTKLVGTPTFPQIVVELDLRRPGLP